MAADTWQTGLIERRGSVEALRESDARGLLLLASIVATIRLTTRRSRRRGNGKRRGSALNVDMAMGESSRRSWVRTAVLLGMGYALVGIVFAAPTTHVHAWRLAAWVVSAIGYAAHIANERFRLQNSPGSAALHVAFAVALGAFGLAVGANIHSLSAGSTNQHRQLLLLSLGIWPIMAALPAFLVALGMNAVLARAFGSVQGK